MSDLSGSHEPAGDPPPAGSARSIDLGATVERLRSRSGDAMRAVVLSGSHATGEAAWAEVGARLVCLSDVDLYVILRDEAACDAARRMDAADPQALRALSPAILGPLEVAYLTPDGLARMQARPGTIVLRERGRMLLGDRAVLECIPRFHASDIGREERLLMLENRGAELLGAACPRRTAGDAEHLQARHATLKVALDLAGALLLEQGEWPLEARDRVRRAEQVLTGGSADAGAGQTPSILPRLWYEALRWRSAVARAPQQQVAQADWQNVVRAWCWLWWRVADREQQRGPEPWPSIRAVAARAPWLRRVRRALDFAPRAGAAPSLRERLRHMADGTPLHRLNGSVSTLLFAAAVDESAPALPSGALRLLGTLAVVKEPEWEAAAADAHRIWARWVAGVAEDGA